MLKSIYIVFFSFFIGNGVFAQDSTRLALVADEEISVSEGFNVVDFSKTFGVKDSVQNPKLYMAVKGWLYTKYRYGGHTDCGIDCSGFTKAIYSAAYAIHLAGGGSASIFQKDVSPIQKEELKEGDLVFFIIRKKRISHVGIYLGSNKFVHASRHSGVIVSDLDEPYYKKRFYKGGRHKSFILCTAIK